MESSASSISTAAAILKREVGQVKWFDRTKGYGFITQLSNNTDIFIHFSQIYGEHNAFRYLVAGEYVEFAPVTLGSGPGQGQSQGHGGLEEKIVASEVTGIQNGKLMYQVSSELRKESEDFKEATSSMSKEGVKVVKKFNYTTMGNRGSGDGKGGGKPV
jgi:CspA family cold shock protein